MDKDYYLKLRNHHFPSDLRTIFILESPPESGKYFYDETGKVTEPLFKAMMILLNFSPETKKDGLLLFQKTGHFLVDATYKPINKLRGRVRNEAIMADYESLLMEIKRLNSIKKPDIILVKANICKLLAKKLNSEGFNIKNENVVIPFPSTGQQNNFFKAMKKVYGNN